MQFIINTIIAFGYAAIVAIISSVCNNGFDSEIFHYALFDFFVVQIFLIVLEIYRDRSSKEIKFLKKPDYREYVEGLMEFDKESNTNPIKMKLVLLSLDKCLEYCRMKENQDVRLSITAMKEIKDMLAVSSKECKYLCRMEQFQESDIEDFDFIVIFYSTYSELYPFEQHFGKLLASEKVSFYRRHEEANITPYYLFDEKYSIVEEKDNNYVLYSNHEIVLEYIKDFAAIQLKSVPLGKTQSQDSLFLNQAIKEFYGDGNIPNIYLDKIPTSIGRKILDLGTGAGRLLNYFTDASKYEVIAMDKDKTALEECKRNFSEYSHIEYVWDKFDENSFQPNQFDVVIAFNSLYHTDRASISKVISRIKQILKPGGYFLLTLKTLEGNEKYIDTLENYIQKSLKIHLLILIFRITIYLIIFVMMKKLIYI